MSLNMYSITDMPDDIIFKQPYNIYIYYLYAYPENIN